MFKFAILFALLVASLASPAAHKDDKRVPRAAHHRESHCDGPTGFGGPGGFGGSGADADAKAGAFGGMPFGGIGGESNANAQAPASSGAFGK